MRIDPEGKALHGASTFITFIVLNVLYILTCVPLITIGVATSSLYDVTMRYSDEEGGHLIKDFFVAFKDNAVRATSVYLCLLLPLAALVFSGVFWVFQSGTFSIAAAIVAFLGALYLFAAFLFGMALVARYRNSLRQTLKNALLLPLAEPWRAFVLIVIPATLLSLTAVIPAFLAILGTIGFSVGAYASGFLFRGAFTRH